MPQNSTLEAAIAALDRLKARSLPGSLGTDVRRLLKLLKRKAAKPSRQPLVITIKPMEGSPQNAPVLRSETPGYSPQDSQDETLGELLAALGRSPVILRKLAPVLKEAIADLEAGAKDDKDDYPDLQIWLHT